jgi:hypothetical protein
MTLEELLFIYDVIIHPGSSPENIAKAEEIIERELELKKFEKQWPIMKEEGDY